jgi:DNA-binding HxlR family transcriptional regulator
VNELERAARMPDRLSSRTEEIPTIIIGKWTVRVMRSLRSGPLRHGQLRRGLGTVSQRMLTRTLRNLESVGLISRKEIHTKSRAVEYSMTRLGKAFLVPLDGICRWASRHSKELRPIARSTRRTREIG